MVSSTLQTINITSYKQPKTLIPHTGNSRKERGSAIWNVKW